jgi:TolB protein
MTADVRRRWLRRLATCICGLVLLLLGPAAHAELQIDITRGTVEPLPIAILPFQGTNADLPSLGRDVSAVISADLGGSGLFLPLDTTAFEASQPPLDVLPKFADWRQINAQALVQGRTMVAADGRVKIEFRLWDVFAGQEMLGRAYTTQPGNWRRIAHVIADAIYKRVTGEDGYFDTRIVYVAESGPHSRRIKRLAIMDQDGANHQFLTDGNALVLTPRFSPSLQQITYLKYAGGIPRVFTRVLETSADEVVGDFPGMTFAPRFSPDGERLIMSMALDGNSDIYTVDLTTRAKRRLTSNSAIDTSPSYAPDSRHIVFNSDRGGGQQLYVMDADGANVRRISHGEGRYATPVWSPRADLIAFTKIQGNRFYIGVMRPDGSGERLLTSGYRVEGPTWAPNGRIIMYYRQEPVISETRGGRSRLHTIDLTGQNEREVATPQDASDPAWSPLRP